MALLVSPPPSPGGRNSHLARKESRKWHSESFPHFFLIFVSPPRFPLSTVGVASHRDDTSCLPTSAEKLEARKKKGNLRNRKWLSISGEEKEKGGGVRSVFFLFCYGRRNTLEKNLGYSLLAPVQTKVSFCKVSRLRRRRRRRVVELSLERRSPSAFLRRPPTLVLMPSRSHLLPLGRSIAVPSRGKGGGEDSGWAKEGETLF